MREKTGKIVLTALFAALVFVFTLLSVPAPLVGNVNLGDGMVLLCAFVLGGPWAAVAAGLGAGLCDLTNGYAMYAPATFLIKALMAAVAVLLYRLLTRLHLPRKAALPVAGLSGELIMVGGYFLYEATFLSYGLGAAANIPFNAIQGALGLVLALVMYTVLYKMKLAK